jgi:amylosucrase
MNWSTAQARSEPRAVAGKLFTGFVRLASARVRLAPLHAAASRRILELTDPGILPVLRESPAGVVLQLYNVTPQPRRWRVSAAGDASTALDALHDERVDVGHDGYIALPPYAARWLVAVGE